LVVDLLIDDLCKVLPIEQSPNDFKSTNLKSSTNLTIADRQISNGQAAPPGSGNTGAVALV
jgi:hypothetical protein